MNYLKRKPKAITDGFSFFHLHHFFTGFLIAAVGFYLLFQYYFITGASICVLGLWVLIDDIIQHYLQGLQKIGKIPIHIKVVGSSNDQHLLRIIPDYYDIVTFWHWFPEQLFGKRFIDYEQ